MVGQCQSHNTEWKTSMSRVCDLLQVLEALVLGRFQMDDSIRARASNEAGPHAADGCGRGLEQLCPVELEDETALHLVDYLR